jgi:hypothetical protein
MKTFKSIILVAAIFLTAGHSAGAQSAVKTVRPTSPDAMVTELYRQSGKNRSPFFQTRSRALVDKYFDRRLGDLIWKDAITSKGEVGALDGDPLYNAQDTEIKNFVVHKPAVANGTAEVKVSFENFGKKQEILFLLSSKNKSAGWKIANLKYNDGSNLLGILQSGN